MSNSAFSSGFESDSFESRVSQRERVLKKQHIPSVEAAFIQKSARPF